MVDESININTNRPVDEKTKWLGELKSEIEGGIIVRMKTPPLSNFPGAVNKKQTDYVMLLGIVAMVMSLLIGVLVWIVGR